MSNPPLPPPPEPAPGQGWTLPGSTPPAAGQHATGGQRLPYPPAPQGYPAPQQTWAGYPQYTGYPVGQPYPGHGAWYPQGPVPYPTTMPGTVKTARVLLFVFGGIYTAAGLILMVVAAAQNGLDEMSAGSAIGLGAVVAAFGVPAVWAGLLFRRGRTGARAFANVAASLLCFIGLASANLVVGLGVVAAAILVMVFVSNTAGSAWFKRPAT